DQSRRRRDPGRGARRTPEQARWEVRRGPHRPDREPAGGDQVARDLRGAGSRHPPSRAPRARGHGADEGDAALQGEGRAGVRRPRVQRPVVHRTPSRSRGVCTQHAAFRERRDPRTTSSRAGDRRRPALAALALFHSTRDVRQGRPVRPQGVRGLHHGLRSAAPYAGADPVAVGRGERGDARRAEEGPRGAEGEEEDQVSKDLWKGRFEGGLDPKVRDFTASLELDKRLASHDVRGSIAHARMLGRQSVISKDEAAKLVRELERIAGEIEAGTFAWPADAEDVHSAVERVLTERAGAVGGKLHTGRSRNDQIALDLRLLVVELLDGLDAALRSLARALVERASEESDTVMPGYTHLQRAQPVSLAHHLLAHVEALRRDRMRVNEARERAAVSPLGAGALAGVPYAIDPQAVAKELGLARTFRNSIDAVADRDFVADFAYVCALAAVHASRFAEELVLWTSAEFGFAEFSDQHATGSSIMPQKKNPDVAELVRGRTGRIIGDLVAILTTLKGLPLAYD